MENHKCNRSPSPSPSSSSFSSPTVRHRSKRIRRPQSSPEEVVAYCLMMLSRDKWTDEEEEEIDDELGSESESELELVMKVKRTPTRNNYRCEICKKNFKSYQALGGHIASHKKIKLNHHNNNHQTAIEDKIYECHVCFKVFASGQALGGHKRSHVKVVKQRINLNLIDLNLPAPSVDHDDY